MTQVEPVATPSAVVELTIRGGSDCKRTAGLIGKHIVEGTARVSLHCCGAAAVNQGIKSIAIARHFAALEGVDLRCAPRVTTVKPFRPHRSGQADIITIVIIDVEVVQ
jgi:stage V sporulation protein SpoVS